jgi:cell wall-associated NlpC family hydrolase
MRDTHPVATLYDSVEPNRWRRERQLVLHDVFQVLEEGNGWAFGYAERDGFVGYMDRDALAPASLTTPTHVVSARQSYLTPVPELKNKAPMVPISLGTALEVRGLHEQGRWAEVAVLHNGPARRGSAATAYVPAQHLRPLNQPETDPATIAESFIGTPYHWGGNTGWGIDCSGLVQAACLACGIPCPGDSDQQENRLGNHLPEGTSPKRNDLLFWKGHVALVVTNSTLIHANAHHMAVAYENIDSALARIEKQGDGRVTSHKRLP